MPCAMENLPFGSFSMANVAIRQWKRCPPQLSNARYWRMDIVAIASLQHLSNMFSLFSSLSPLTSLEMTDLKSERTSLTQGTVLLLPGDAYLL